MLVIGNIEWYDSNRQPIQEFEVYDQFQMANNKIILTVDIISIGSL